MYPIFFTLRFLQQQNIIIIKKTFKKKHKAICTQKNRDKNKEKGRTVLKRSKATQFFFAFPYV